MPRVFIKRAAVVATVAMIASTFTAAAYGAKPDTFPLPTTASNVVTSLCDFPVTIDSTFSGGQFRLHYDSNGTVTRIQVRTKETDTFSANGKSIVGLPYTAINVVRFDSDGNVTSEVIHGVIERVVLPDGTLFVSAGTYVNESLLPGFTVTPTVGHSGDVDALCAALAA